MAFFKGTSLAFQRQSGWSGQKELNLSTHFFQSSLPRLVVPPLEQSVTAIVKSFAAVQSPSQQQTTQKIALDFLQHEGPVLQKELVLTNRANRHTNYSCADDLDRKLCKRDGLCASCTTHWAVAKTLTSRNDLLRNAAAWCAAAVRWNQKLRDNTLPPPVADAIGHRYVWKEWIQQTVALSPSRWRTPLIGALTGGKAKPLDSSSLKFLFNASRVPGVVQDTFFLAGFHGHIVVQYRNVLYIVQMADRNGVCCSYSSFCSQLEQIMEGRSAQTQTVDISAFTSLQRDEWNAVQSELSRSPVNSWALNMVKSALFLLCLHDREETSMFSSGRWLDKSLVIDAYYDRIEISGDGGIAEPEVLQQFTEDVHLSFATAAISRNSPVPIPCVSTPLTWSLSNTHVAAALNSSNRWLRLVHQDNGAETRFGCLKGVTLSEYDSFLQLVTLSALWKVTRKQLLIVEPLTLRHFLKGPTDILPLNTPVFMDFAECLLRQGSTEMVVKYRSAVQEYAERKRAVQRGGGFFRHLVSLRCTAERLFTRIPLFLEDSFLKGADSPLVVSSVRWVENTIPKLSSFPAKGCSICWGVHRFGEVHVQVKSNNNTCSANELLESIIETKKSMEALCDEVQGHGR